MLPAWRRAQALFDQQFGAQQGAALLSTMRAVVDSGLHRIEDKAEEPGAA